MKKFKDKPSFFGLFYFMRNNHINEYGKNKYFYYYRTKLALYIGKDVKACENSTAIHFVIWFTFFFYSSHFQFMFYDTIFLQKELSDLKT